MASIRHYLASEASRALAQTYSNLEQRVHKGGFYANSILIAASPASDQSRQPVTSKRSALMPITFGSWDREAERRGARWRAGWGGPPPIDMAVGPIDGVQEPSNLEQRYSRF